MAGNAFLIRLGAAIARREASRRRPNPWIALADTLNDALHQPYCPAPCEHGGRCSLPNGHDGSHQAVGSGSRILCVWP